MTAAYNLSDYLPPSPPPLEPLLRLEELNQRSTMLAEKMEHQSREVSERTATIVAGLRELVDKIEKDAHKGTLSDLTEVVDAMEAMEDEWAAGYLPQMGNFMGGVFKCRALQRDLSKLKATRELAQTAKVASILTQIVGQMVTALEAIRDSRIGIALTWSRYVEAREGPGTVLSSPGDVDAFFKTIPDA